MSQATDAAKSAAHSAERGREATGQILQAMKTNGSARDETKRSIRADF